MTKDDFNAVSHCEDLRSAISVLCEISAKSGSPAPIQHQYVGTVLDNTIALLAASMNSLCDTNLTVKYSEPSNWLSLMQCVHRSFFSQMHIATECALTEFCNTSNVQIISSHSRRCVDLVSKISDEVSSDSGQKVIKKLMNIFETSKPSFDDALNASLKCSKLSGDRKSTWRSFFRAFTIIRNKVSHSDPSLASHEITALRCGGFHDFIDLNDAIVINPSLYGKVAKKLLEFFDELTKLDNS